MTRQEDICHLSFVLSSTKASDVLSSYYLPLFLTGFFISKEFMAVCKYSVELAAKESAIYTEIHVLTKKH